MVQISLDGISILCPVSVSVGYAIWYDEWFTMGYN